MYRPELYGPAPKNPKLSIMIWGCITSKGVGTLYMTEENINAEHYKVILDEMVWPVIAKNFPDNNYIYQDDNATPHRAGIIKEYAAEQQLKTMTWPACSPDLNIIENVWAVLKMNIQRHLCEINTLDDLKSVILKCWDSLEQSYIKRLYLSIPRRLRAVRLSKGHLTKY
jgi:hypothetical protein